jgi:hypothetical protein
MITASFGGGGWKQTIFHDWRATCAALEITTNNGYYRNFPQMYTECGSGMFEFYSTADSSVVLENGVPKPGPAPVTEYWCLHSNPNGTNSRCAWYQANQWMTFYYEIIIGSWGQPNSTVRAWVGFEGQPLKKFIDAPNFTLKQDASDRLFDTVTLLTYDTGKDGRQHPTAYTWYDELIISSQPIAAPGAGTSPPPQAPNAPTNLVLQ